MKIIESEEWMKLYNKIGDLILPKHANMLMFFFFLFSVLYESHRVYYWEGRDDEPVGPDKMKVMHVLERWSHALVFGWLLAMVKRVVLIQILSYRCSHRRVEDILYFDWLHQNKRPRIIFHCITTHTYLPWKNLKNCSIIFMWNFLVNYNLFWQWLSMKKKKKWACIE